MEPIKKLSRGQASLPHWHRRVLYAAMISLLVVGTVLVNVIAGLLGRRLSLNMDLTANAVYEVGPETKTLLGNLSKDVDIYILASEDSFAGAPYLIQARRTLEQYPRYSPRIALRFVDYISDPTFSSQYPQLSLSAGSLLVVCGERQKQMQLSEIFNYAYNQAGKLEIVSSRAEEALTSAILNVISDRQVRVAALNGNGLVKMPAFEALLTANNYLLSNTTLVTDSLENYDVLLLLSPQADLSEDMLRKLDEYLYSGGNYGKTVFYTASVDQAPLPNLDAYLKEWGISVDDGAVFETTSNRTYQHQPFYPTAAYVDEAFRDSLTDLSTPLLMPLSRPLTVSFKSRDGCENRILAQFSESSGVRPSDVAEGFTPDQAQRRGPLPALVLSSKGAYGTGDSAQSRSHLVVSASTIMLESFSIQNTSLANSEYLLGLLNTLCGREDIVSISPKSLAGNTLTVTTFQANLMGILLAGALPILILSAGLAVWLRRRYQ